jgi:hypothetical protein
MNCYSSHSYKQHYLWHWCLQFILNPFQVQKWPSSWPVSYY